MAASGGKFELKLFLARRRDLLLVVLAALVVRLVWNLWIHKPLDYAVSDMGGYLERAQTSIDRPDARLPYFTLFPWGTHFLLSLVKRAFGAQNGAAIGAAYALLGAGAAGYGFALAQRFTRRPLLARIVGAVLVLYYPWIALGGYTLSEPPFTFFLTATTFHALAYADRGRARDAWLTGGALAIAAIFRPQILVALPLYALVFLWRRRVFRRFRPAILLPALAVPLAIITIASGMRMQFHTGKWGFVSSNGPLNYAFGRCHATVITSAAPDRKGIYSPPSLGGLAHFGSTHPSSPIQLDPVMGTKIDFQGHMWDAEPLAAVARDCVQRSGMGKQIKFGITHVLMLWFFNATWPDSGQPRFRGPMEIAQATHNVLVLPAAIVAIALAFRRRNARALLLSLHVLGLMVVAALYFGDTRLRVPYDGILITLAASAYACGIAELKKRRAVSRRR
jgi:hypothetical protein